MFRPQEGFIYPSFTGDSDSTSDCTLKGALILYKCINKSTGDVCVFVCVLW